MATESENNIFIYWLQSILFYSISFLITGINLLIFLRITYRCLRDVRSG